MPEELSSNKVLGTKVWTKKASWKRIRRTGEDGKMVKVGRQGLEVYPRFKPGSSFSFSPILPFLLNLLVRYQW
jgi:hypothetical protein